MKKFKLTVRTNFYFWLVCPECGHTEEATSQIKNCPKCGVVLKYQVQG